MTDPDTNAEVPAATGQASPDGGAQYRRSLYRHYRPQTFPEVVGQEHVARTLTNAISLDAVAHGYVFAGPRGTGKTSMARILAKALNCTGADAGHPVTAPTTEPCGTCESCRRIAAAESLDVIEMDAASHRSIDDIRELRDTIAYAPVHSRYKVYIIDEAHMLTREAFNALLKTLEEPPANVVFVLATTEAHKLPETIVSRCQRFDFRRPRSEEVVRVLRRVADGEHFDVDDDALATIAEHSEGGFRDAIGALERLATFAAGGERLGTAQVLELLGVTDTELLVEVTEIIADHDTVEALAFVHRLYDRGINWTQFINDLLRHLRRLFLLQNVGHGVGDPKVMRALAQTVGLHEALVERLEPQASRLDHGLVLRMMELLGEALGNIKAGLDGRLQLELVLVKCTRPQLDLSLAGLDARLKRLEEGAPAPAASPGARPPDTDEKAPPPAAGTVLSTAGAKARPVAKAAAPADAAPVHAASHPAEAAPPPVDEAPPPVDESPPPVEERTRNEPPPGASSDEEPPGDQAPAEVPAPEESIVEPPGEGPVAARPPADPLAAAAAGRWAEILGRLRVHSKPAASLLGDARPVDVRDGRLAIAVATRFSRDQLAEPDTAALVAGAVGEVLGRPVVVTFEVDPAVAGQRPVVEEHGGLSIEEAIALGRDKLDARLMDEDDGH